jgi:glycosyltransferase involved in cell wall biosynthesis
MPARLTDTAQVPQPRLLVVGPMPPPFGGIAVITRQLVESDLPRYYALSVLNINRPSVVTENISGNRGIDFYKTFRLLAVYLRSVVRLRPSAILMEMNGDISCFREAALILMTRAFSRARIVVHFHGGMRPRIRWRSYPFGTSHGRSGALVRLGANLAFAGAHRIAFLSEPLRESFHGVLSRHNYKKSAVVENFVDVRKFCPSTDHSGRPIRLLFLGRLSEAKGFFDLVRILPRLASRCGPLVLCCCGIPETETSLDPIRELIRDCQEQGLLELPGLVQGEEKARRFAEADILVHPSHRDVFPVTVLEGLAQGLPIVTTPMGSIPSMVRDGINALLLSPGDLVALEDTLVRLVADIPRRRAMAAANRKLAEERFDISITVRRFRELLDTASTEEAGTGVQA